LGAPELGAPSFKGANTLGLEVEDAIMNMNLFIK
jgi:hypothetical protein